MRKKSEGLANSRLVWPIVFLTLFILGLFGYSISKEMNKKKQVEKEIDSLKEQAEKIDKENMALEERISYLGSKDYQEMQAKDKLNLQSPGESVVVIAEGPVKSKKNFEDVISPPAESPARTSNFKKWLDYFFKQ